MATMFFKPAIAGMLAAGLIAASPAHAALDNAEVNQAVFRYKTDSYQATPRFQQAAPERPEPQFTASQSAPAPRQEQQGGSDAGDIAKTAVITTLIGILVSAIVCSVSGVCMVTLP